MKWKLQTAVGKGITNAGITDKVSQAVTDAKINIQATNAVSRAITTQNLVTKDDLTAATKDLATKLDTELKTVLESKDEATQHIKTIFQAASVSS